MTDTTGGQLELMVLAAVDAGASHGYAVIEALRARSDGAFDLPEGTVYPALHRLESKQLLASHWADGSGRRRRVYQLTSSGRRALREGRRDWRAFARAVASVVGSP
ncbi:MAG TPA: helix-turn-helix transcriptional regulator [Candidatus Binatia bacterium]|nr:helix-turn-helix transcriptional regulator [Candidatus Binatia bacterium]